MRRNARRTLRERSRSQQSSPAAVAGSIHIYARHLASADVNAAIQFYSTPEGDHVRRAVQDMASETMKFGQDLGVKNAPLILKSLCNQYPELQYDARFCGKPEDKSKSELLSRARVEGE